MLYLLLYFPFVVTGLAIALWVHVGEGKKHPKDVDLALPYIIFAFTPVLNIVLTLFVLFVVGTYIVDLAKRLLP